jgi:hypothetical protein
MVHFLSTLIEFIDLSLRKKTSKLLAKEERKEGRIN